MSTDQHDDVFLSVKIASLLLIVATVTGLVLVNSPVRADLEFGHVDAVEETVDELDEKIREGGGDGSGGGCSVNYGPWLSGIESMSDLDDELLETDMDTASKLDVIGNNRFSEDNPAGTELTTDTMIERCNTTFGDTGNPAYEHHIFCRGFRLPDGKKYESFAEIQSDVTPAPTDLVTLSFFHAGNIDDDSEIWLPDFIDSYQSSCRNRTTHVILMGAYVTTDTDGRKITDGNKWHLTSSKWQGTILDNVMAPSEQIITGHSTASCPFDNADTRGLYVGGQNESAGRSLTGRVGSEALWVGKNSVTPAPCYKGVSDSNPANANVAGGIQLEYQVDVDLNPEVISRAILREEYF
jgi:hypothetical protein